MSEMPALVSEHGGTNEALVTVGDVLQTYPLKTRERYYQYLEALVLRQKGYFQREIAARLHINHHRVWNWLKGRYKPVPANQIASFQKLGLLPFKLNLTNPKCLLILKIGFFTLGDGHIMSKRGGIILTGYPPDLDKIEKECKEIGLPCQRYKDSRYLYVGEGIARILIKLGFPKGRKTVQEFLLPDWLLHGPLGVKKLFLSVIFGNECNINTNDKHKLRTIKMTMVKKVQLEDNLIEFCKQIQKLLKEFNVMSHVSMYRKWGYCFCTVAVSDVMSILNFYMKIGLLYAKDKEEKLEKLVQNIEGMLQRYFRYIREFENVMKNRKWNRQQVSWGTFYAWTRWGRKPAFYEKREELFNLLSALKVVEAFRHYHT